MSALPSLSYVCGTSEEPLLYLTIGDLLARAAREWPEREALIVRHQNWRLTYAEFNWKVNELARALIAQGLKPGDRVAIWSPNCAEWVLTQFATARAGLILVNINPAYRGSELDYCLRKVGCRALVMATAFKASDYVGLVRTLIPPECFRGEGRIACGTYPELELLIQLSSEAISGLLTYADLLRGAVRVTEEELLDLSRSLNPEQPINIQFTSGTTGSPKGATLTHFNVVNNGFFVGEGMRLTHEDRLCIPVPLYHCFGMVLGVLAAVTHGATMVFPSESFDPEKVLATVETERCTALHGVPTMFIAELEHPRFRDFDLSSLRTGIMAGAPCPIAVMRRVVAEMHLKEITICYGMTETSPVSFQSRVDDPLERRVATVGRIHPHLQAKVIDASGGVAPRSTPGQLCTRGYGVMQGYWGDPERTAEAIDGNGWMHTGDLAVLDAEGFCNIVGRVKDMIIRGGENIYPREIEEFLYRHPKVREVAVVGLPDPKYGEVVCAVIRLREGTQADAEEIREFCRDNIAHYKVPHHVCFVESFPMTVTGKVQKFLIRQQLEAELGLHAERTA